MKAIALISGGLDSTLAAKLVKALGINLVALNTVSPFCLCSRGSGKGCGSMAGAVAHNLGLELVSINVTDEILKIVKNPAHGYGSNMNPCIDCRILLFKKAKDLMHKEGASFIITGEVLGQRPMSQKLHTMRLIEKEAGLAGLVVRPLCAKILEPTIAEKEGWIARDKLLAIQGRGRREQIALASQLAISDYPCPSGGCLLTDPGFSRRLKDLINYGKLKLDEVLLLKVGRHFRLSPQAKLVVGRNEDENKRLLSLAKETDYIFKPNDEVRGPTALGRGEFPDDSVILSCRILSRYCDINASPDFSICYRQAHQAKERLLRTKPIKDTELNAFRV